MASSDIGEPYEQSETQSTLDVGFSRRNGRLSASSSAENVASHQAASSWQRALSWAITAHIAGTVHADLKNIFLLGNPRALPVKDNPGDTDWTPFWLISANHGRQDSQATYRRLGRGPGDCVGENGTVISSLTRMDLLRKIDFFILTYCCVAFFFNYLDRAALANAYVSGLKEDLNIQGNQYNILVTCLSVGYIIGQVPHAIVIQVVAPRIWFPLMTAIWAGLTMCSAATHNFSQLAAIRFFQGVIEASTYSGTQYIIGSWYKPQEIGKRVGLFSASGMAGTMFAGIMMTAIYETMNGHLGLPGWRWVFIIDGIITLPIAIFGFAFFPDLPENTKAFYLNEEERRLALTRLPPKNPEGHNIGFSLVKRSLLSLNFWVFTMFWVIGGALEAFSTQSCMLLWMKTTDRFTVPQNNNYPLGITAIGIVATLVTSVAIDATGKNGPFGILACVLQIIACVVLLCWNMVGDGAKMGAYYLAGTAYLIQPVCFTWATKILSRDGDDAARAVTLYAMNGASSVLFSFWGIILYPATDAATGFKKGTIAMVVISALLVGWIFIVLWQDKRTERIYGAAVAVRDKEREMGVQLEERGEKGGEVEEKGGKE